MNKSSNGPEPSSDGLSIEARLWRLAMILSAARRIHSSLSLDMVLRSFLGIATGEVGSAGGGIFLEGKEGALIPKDSSWPKQLNDEDRSRFREFAQESAESGKISEVADENTSYVVISLPLLSESESSIGVLQILKNLGDTLEDDERLFLKELSHFAALSIKNAQYHLDSVEKAHLESEIGVAREIQVGTLPDAMPKLEGYDVAGFSRPAEQTGGDSFDLVESEAGELTLLLADATGHGLGPALSVTQVRSMLRIAVRLGIDLGEILGKINDQLCQDLAAHRFVTAFFGRLEIDAHRLYYYSAGQGPLLLYRAASDKCELLDITCPPLGVVPMRGDVEAKVVELQEGDVLALMTDGVFEAENEGDEMLEKEPIMELLRELRDRSSRELIQAILEKVDAFRRDGPQEDDITVVIIKRTA